MTPQSFRTVLLDVDGTLIASNDAHAHAWVDAFAERNIDVPFEKVRRLIGMGGDQLMPAAAGIEKHTAQGTQISDRRTQIFKEKYLNQIQPCPGAMELLAHLRAHGLTLIVASSAAESELEALLAIVDATDLMEQATSSDDAEHSKPAPDIVQAALGQAGKPAHAVVMIGDTPYDIEAAQRAGVPLIAVRCGGWDDDDLRGALAIYDHPADLLAQYDESPLA